MPDSGYNGYISVGADGRVVTPTNLTPGGIIAAGDLATHADLDTLADTIATTYDLPDVAHQADLPDLSAYVDAVDSDGNPINRRIKGQFALPLNTAATFDTFFSADYDFGPGSIRDWAEFVFAGYFVGTGALCLATVDNSISSTISRFWFCSLSSSLQAINGFFNFYVIGTPA